MLSSCVEQWCHLVGTVWCARALEQLLLMTCCTGKGLVGAAPPTPPPPTPQDQPVLGTEQNRHSLQGWRRPGWPPQVCRQSQVSGTGLVTKGPLCTAFCRDARSILCRGQSTQAGGWFWSGPLGHVPKGRNSTAHTVPGPGERTHRGRTSLAPAGPAYAESAPLGCAGGSWVSECWAGLCACLAASQPSADGQAGGQLVNRLHPRTCARM